MSFYTDILVIVRGLGVDPSQVENVLSQFINGHFKYVETDVDGYFFEALANYFDKVEFDHRLREAKFDGKITSVQYLYRTEHLDVFDVSTTPGHSGSP